MHALAASAPSDLQVAFSAFLASPAAAVLVFVFGTLWGSFFNVCIARIPLGRSVVKPRSFCFACKKTIPGWHNIPMLSYLILRGRCGSCGVKYSPRYLLVELLMGLFSLMIFWLFVRSSDAELSILLARFATYFAFAGVLVVLGFIDLDTKRLPDIITLPAIPIFFLAGFATHAVPWDERAIGMVAGYLSVRLISDAYYYLRGREGLGLGDGKLLSVVGALLGWKALPPIVFFASLLGVLVAVPALWLARGRPEDATVPAENEEQGGEDEPEEEQLRFVQIPFGPFLAMGALAYLFTADALLPWFLDFLSGGA